MKKLIDILSLIYIFGTLVFSIAVAVPHGFWAVVAGVLLMWPTFLIGWVLVYAGITGTGTKN